MDKSFTNMKKVVLLLLVTIFVSCKNDANTEDKKVIGADDKEKTAKQSDGLTLLKGDFIYYSDAAVLQTPKNMYGVIVDAKMQELNDMAKAYKNEPTDFVQVEIRGKITPKPENEEGWPFRVEIKEILNVTKSADNSSETLKLGN